MRGRRVAEPVSLLDLAPTLLDLAGLDASDLGDIDGRSLAPVLRGEGRRGAPVVAEYLAEGVSAPMVMVRDGALKYVRCPGDPDVLYDLDADPRERRNLAPGAEHGAAARLRAEADRRWDLGGLERAVLDSQRERRVVVPALNRGRHTAWDYVPQSQAMRYIGTQRGPVRAPAPRAAGRRTTGGPPRSCGRAGRGGLRHRGRRRSGTPACAP